MKTTQEIVNLGLEEALIKQFCLLFEVLMHDPSEEGYSRFTRGAKNAIAVYEKIVQEPWLYGDS